MTCHVMTQGRKSRTRKRLLRRSAKRAASCVARNGALQRRCRRAFVLEAHGSAGARACRYGCAMRRSKPCAKRAFAPRHRRRRRFQLIRCCRSRECGSGSGFRGRTCPIESEEAKALDSRVRGNDGGNDLRRGNRSSAPPLQPTDRTTRTHKENPQCSGTRGS